jgi:diaminopimelate decarboxylase
VEEVTAPPPPHVADAIARATGPSLIYDAAAIEVAMRRAATAGRRHGVRVLFAAKSFPHPAILDLAARILDGFDLAGSGERDVDRGGAWSITDPGLDPSRLPARPLAVTCESADAVRAVRAARPDAAIALRVSISSLMPGDDAVGALAAGDGHRRSRFGVDAGGDELRAMADAARGAPRLGVHVHSAGVVPAIPARWGEIACRLAAVAEGIGADFVDLGGSWHGVAGALEDAIAAARAAVPAAIDVWIEPGRLFAENAGWVVGRVVAARQLADRALRVTTISRVAHLRWTQVALVAPPPSGGGTKVTFAGPTCFEDDIVGDWITDRAFDVGETVVWSGATGYACAWNRGFSGVPAADVIVTR